MELLKRAVRRGELQFHGRLAMLANLADFEQYLNMATRKDWVVDARRPIGSAERVLKYLARYVNRVAISNRELLDMKDGKVRFRYKDYADKGRQKGQGKTETCLEPSRPRFHHSGDCERPRCE